MSTAGKSPHSHGRSEIWTRTALTRTIHGELKRLGEHLRTLRLQHGLTQEQAAEAIGIHPKSLTRVENGSANVTVAVLVAAAAAFKVPLRELFPEQDDNGSDKS